MSMTVPGAKIEVRTLKVEDVLDRLRAGSIRIPEFQRPLKWKREDNRLFFDSLLRGYPVGSLLVWERPEEAGTVRLGPFETVAPSDARAWRIVDGQQRLTALAGALLPVVKKRGGDHDFAVEISTGDIETAPPRHEGPFVPLDVLGSIDALVPWLHAHTGIDVQRVAELSKRLREYPLSIVVLDVPDQAFVEDVFKRLNRTGKRLTQAQVFRASHGRKPAGRALARAMAIGSELRFGTLDESNLLRALKVASGRDPLSELKEPDPENAEDLVRGVRDAVVLLKQTGVPRADLLPFSLPFGVLVAFFARHRDVAARNRKLLELWFWRGTLSLKLQGDFTSIRDLYSKAVIDDEHVAVQELLSAAPLSFLGIDPQGSFASRSAAGKLVILTLLAQGPRHLETGTPLSPSRLLEARPLRELLQPLVPQAGNLGTLNTLFHPRLPRARLRKALEVAGPDVLQSHLIEPSFEDSIAWAEKRASSVLEAVEVFGENKGGLHEPTRPPLSALGDPLS